jgi:hypothetical protein
LFLLGPWIAILGIAGCFTPQTVADQSAMLASSGFVQRAADTPQKQAMLARLPRYGLVKRPWNGKVIYVYAGNPACNCAYLGNEAAFARYQQNILAVARQGTAASFVQARRGNEQQQSISVRDDPSFDPEPWGVSDWRD